MEIIFSKLFKIDITAETAEERPDLHKIANFKVYIQNMLEQISEKNPDRYYKFRSEHTEVRNLINNILYESEYDNSSLAIANRLLEKERLAQEDLIKKKLSQRITKGMLIVSLIRMTQEASKLVILKVDYDEFISDLTGEIATGLSIRRKVYKALICELDNDNTIISTAIYDTNSSSSSYWWDKFLELDVIRQNNINTKNAFDAIHGEILKPLKTNYKQDYLHLWNITLGYFRLGGEFNLDFYVTDILGNYTPYNEKVNMGELMTKCTKLPEKLAEKNKFDRRFTKDKATLKGKKYHETIKISNEIDLVFNDHVANLANIITSKHDPDTNEKFLIIRSDLGYEYAKSLKKDINE